jgi:trimethylamine:corrinoid methyltransferase-like protein
LRRIYDTSLDLLEKLGIGEVPDRLRADLLAIGATDNGQGRILFPPALVEEAIDPPLAPRGAASDSMRCAKGWRSSTRRTSWAV